MLQGAYSYVLQDEDGQVPLTHSVSAGLDYAMIGPEHAWLHDQHRAEYVAVRRGGARGRAPALADRGHHPGAGIRARRGRSRQARRRRRGRCFW